MKMRSNSELFRSLPAANIPRSLFDRSAPYKTAFDAGYLIPFYVEEALPGDTANVKVTAFARLATPLFPLMDNMDMEFFFFAVPNRHLWTNWKKFNGEQEDPGDSTDFTIPTFSAGSILENSIHDYMGIPPGADATTISMLPARAYGQIWNQWFRDQNLQDSLTISTGDAGVSAENSNHDLQRINKRHDYFTSALPWPQKGDSVDLPLGTTAPVVGAGGSGPTFDYDNQTDQGIFALTGTPPHLIGNAAPGATGQLSWSDTDLEADLSTATAATINQLRQAFQMQKLLERDARGGTRYIEIVLAHFGVRSSDQRMQRAEYLGGGKVPVIVSQIAQQSQSDTTPQGHMAGFGTATARGIGFQKSFEEHCTVIGLVAVRADLTYQQGVNRMWTRQTRYDFYWPALAMVGEQAILNQEIYADGSANDTAVFGYAERNAEYRYRPGLITGIMRSASATSLDAWHLSQEFGALPVLDDTFIAENPPIDRVIAVDTEPHFIFDSWIDAKWARPMPMFGIPGLIDHF